MRKYVTYSNVVASIALFAALGLGTAFAATKLANNAVKTKTIKNNAVTTPKIANNAVTGAKANESTFEAVPKATNATSVGTTVTASVTIPGFGAGQNQCNNVDVNVAGVAPGDTVIMTPAGAVSWAGDDQAAITVHEISAGKVNVQGCLSADATTPVTPTATNYKFTVIK